MKNKRVDFFVLLMAAAAWAAAGCQVAERDEGNGDRQEAGVRNLEVALAAQQEEETRTGVSAYPNVSRQQTVAIDGTFAEWAQVSPDFQHYRGNTMHRSHLGHTNGNLAYFNTTGRNDIVDAKVTRDADYVYFYVETAASITAYTDPQWMRLLINKDMNWSTGWKGYDYCLNFETPASATQGYISQCSGTSWSWTRQGTYDYRVTGNKMELRIPRSLFSGSKLDFAFKWADNNLEEWGGARETRILNLYVDGDAAPGGRFNFHYVEP